MWNDPHSIMRYAMVIRFAVILAIALLGLSVGSLTLMLRRSLRPERSPAPSMRERRLS
jgi:hypothetical protein